MMWTRSSHQLFVALEEATGALTEEAVEGPVEFRVFIRQPLRGVLKQQIEVNKVAEPSSQYSKDQKDAKRWGDTGISITTRLWKGPLAIR